MVIRIIMTVFEGTIFKEVCCLNHNSWYESYEDAVAKHNLPSVNELIQIARSTELISYGSDKHLEVPLFWASANMYHRKMKDFNSSNDIEVLMNKRVVCLNTLQGFGAVGKAARTMRVSEPKDIVMSCLSENESAGQLESGEELYWAFEDHFGRSWKDYKANDWRTKYFREIICIETKEVFKSCYEAAHFIKGHHHKIYEACLDESITYGYDPNLLIKRNLHWAFNNDYQKRTPVAALENKRIELKNEKSANTANNFEKVICLTTDELYVSALAVADAFDDLELFGIIKACNERTSYGIDDTTKKPLYWAFYVDK